MTEKELKKHLKKVYNVPESRREKQFLCTYEKRKKRFVDVLRIELKYLGVRSIFLGICLLLLLCFIAKTGNPYFMWSISGVIPIGVLIPMSLINRSKQFGMEELEMASRFSLQMLRVTRLVILGVFSLVVLLIGSGVFGSLLLIRFSDALLCIAIPYLTNVSGCLFISRKWHTKDNLYGCIVVTVLSCFLPYAYEHSKELQEISQLGYIVLFVGLLFISFREAYLYVKESENVSWNLC